MKVTYCVSCRSSLDIPLCTINFVIFGEKNNIEYILTVGVGSIICQYFVSCPIVDQLGKIDVIISSAEHFMEYAKSCSTTKYGFIDV